MPNMLWYSGSSAGCVAEMLARVAAWNCGVGTLTVLTTGTIRYSPSVFTKKKLLSLLIGPPNEAAHMLSLTNGRGTAGELCLLKKLLPFTLRPFQRHIAFP